MSSAGQGGQRAPPPRRSGALTRPPAISAGIDVHRPALRALRMAQGPPCPASRWARRRGWAGKARRVQNSQKQNKAAALLSHANKLRGARSLLFRGRHRPLRKHPGPEKPPAAPTATTVLGTRAQGSHRTR